MRIVGRFILGTHVNSIVMKLLRWGQSNKNLERELEEEIEATSP